jgi:predicted CopG family antitoxin
MAKLKHENESFNELILRLIEQRQDISPFFGMLAGKAGKKLDQAIEEMLIVNEKIDLDSIEGSH